MALDVPPMPDASEGPPASGGGSSPDGGPPERPFTLAALLGLNAEELAQPVPRVAPPEHRWEQLTLGVTPETGEATPSEIRSGAASQPPVGEVELIPGLGTPGAVEVPVYLAGRTLTELARATPPSSAEITETVPAPSDGAEAPPSAPKAIPPLAIKNTALGKPRKKMDAPAANFAKAESGAVLWPTRKPAATTSVLPLECASCGGVIASGDRCAACGHDTAVSARTRRTGVWNTLAASFLESDSRVVRTMGALVLAPGELTNAHLGARHDRYLRPAVVAALTLVVFTIISGIASLRPRPDRALMIGAGQTVEYLAGLVNPAPVNLAIDAPPDLVRDIASTLDDIPLFWLLLTAFGVVAVLAAFGASRGRNDEAEVVFATHYIAWFVLWWGIAVPLLLLGLKFGLEYAAAWQGVGLARALADGRVAGVSSGWNTVRALTIAPGFHSTLLAIGLVPWGSAAYRRAFDASRPRALLAGLVLAGIPILLLLPFA